MAKRPTARVKDASLGILMFVLSLGEIELSQTRLLEKSHRKGPLLDPNEDTDLMITGPQ